MEPPHPPPSRGQLSSSSGGNFQHPNLLPRAHPTPSSLPIAEIGVGTTGFGIFFILFGILLYFDSVLLAFGNLLFLTGLLLIIGLRKTFSFFFQRHKLKGTSFFLGGVVIVLLRWPLLGMFLETYGFLSLFKALLHANLSVSKPFERWCTCSKPDLATGLFSCRLWLPGQCL
ncbi:vesicle transport protein GOT1A isoform X7 [Prionailurus viverrinus]|uniref:vesicle transport protein GOT1A isoform X7 n=1 Tax=Prionailurus viverrinus TaxID=61388 RepID=UPI001FF47FE5|nr:vesicle transport protein GOT1A isoform X7 [Prionailurus viverrinus]